MTPAEARREQAKRDRESAARREGATRSPVQSGGGGGWERQGYHAVPDPVRKVEPYAPRTTTAKEMGGAQDAGGPPKEYGINK